ARARDGGAQELVRDGAAERAEALELLPGEDRHLPRGGPLLAERRADRAHDDVADPVAVHVAGARDRPTEVAGRLLPNDRLQGGARGAGVDRDLPGVLLLRPVVEPGRADDEVGD